MADCTQLIVGDTVVANTHVHDLIFTLAATAGATRLPDDATCVDRAATVRLVEGVIKSVLTSGTPMQVRERIIISTITITIHIINNDTLVMSHEQSIAHVHDNDDD